MQHGPRGQWPRVPAAVGIRFACKAAPFEQDGVKPVEVGWRKFFQRDAANVTAGNATLPTIGGEGGRAVLTAIGKGCNPAFKESFERVLLRIADASLFNFLLHAACERFCLARALEVLAALAASATGARLGPDRAIDHAARRGHAPVDACHVIFPFAVGS